MATFCSFFQQIGVVPRAEFDRLVREYGAERHARGFSSWEQFVSMLFCQLGRAQSLREICDGLQSSRPGLRTGHPYGRSLDGGDLLRAGVLLRRPVENQHHHRIEGRRWAVRHGSIPHTRREATSPTTAIIISIRTRPRGDTVGMLGPAAAAITNVVAFPDPPTAGSSV